jgi:DNA-binding transcriptional regulator YbjK
MYVTPDVAARRRFLLDALALRPGEAVLTVLARDGLAGCTARAVAEASPLTKSALHYYFSDMDKIIDQATVGHIGSSRGFAASSCSFILMPTTRGYTKVGDG